jgi:hypothetical protein
VEVSLPFRVHRVDVVANISSLSSLKERGSSGVVANTNILNITAAQAHINVRNVVGVVVLIVRGFVTVDTLGERMHSGQSV